MGQEARKAEAVASAYDRVDRAVSQMIKRDQAELVAICWRLLHLVTHRPKLPAAFACLAVAELLMLEADEPLVEHEWLRLRNLAVNLAERVAAGRATPC